MANQFEFEKIYDVGGGGTGGSTEIELDTTLTQEGKAADAKSVGDAINTIENKSIDKVIEFNFTSGNNQTVEFDETGIYWENSETEILVENQELFTIGQSNHRLPLVAGDGILFEIDTANKVVKVKTDVAKIKEYIEEIFLNGAW